MKNKLFYPYIIIQFLLFLFSYVCSTGKINFDPLYIILISLLLNVILILLVKARNKKDKLFGLIITSLFLIGIVLSIFFDLWVSYIPYTISMILLVLRTITEKDELFKKTMIISPMIIGGFILIGLLNLLKALYFMYTLLTVFTIFAITVLIIMYYKAENREKQNFFFGFSGCFFFLLFLVTKTFIIGLDETFFLYSSMEMCNNLLFIPSMWMITISFIFFEQREA